MLPLATEERRQLPYEAMDPDWEARELENFRTATGGAQRQVPYGAYLFGRLLQSDLHHSCRPALPSDVSKLNGSTIKGMCILQVVDAANIGANYEHRTQFSTAGPTRTLKLGLTDGHQLVFGFELTPLPQLSVDIPRGTKIVVEDVPVKHGLLLLAPDNCQLLEASSDPSTRSKKQRPRPAESNGTEAGAYSAALVTSQYDTAPLQVLARRPVPAQPPVSLPLDTSLVAHGTPGTKVSGENASALRSNPPARRMNTDTGNSSTSAIRRASDPAVFVDVPPSDEDVDSDTTDPMVTHLFYSPNTPRHPAGFNDAKTAQISNRNVSIKKRPRSPSMKEQLRVGPPVPQNSTQSMDATAVQPERAPSLSLPDQVTPCLPQDPANPFQYFHAKQSTLSAPAHATSFKIRACVKSVVGFQFNTGQYQLRVAVEDCTATKEADVAEEFVTQLMGVSCSAFQQTMQTDVQLAHKWAATMQFTLMNLEGVMTFENRAATSTSEPLPLLLVECRDFQACETRELLQRVRELLSDTTPQQT
uniref:RecQ-mediated genome instability protein 1 n=1 Tax=Peronospora matthiolae TaxID=2874970 RepID=A0AAV1U214_9STRA